MATHHDIFRARQNGSSGGQFVDGVGINSDRVVDLLVEGSVPMRHVSIRRAANALLERMAAEHWRVSAGPHRGGRGGDRSTHITVGFGPGRSYHLRLGRNGHLFQITDPSGRSELDPWAAPGA